MYEYEYNLDTAASAEAIYRLYADVPSWRTWDEGIEAIEFTGSFTVGARGKMKVPGQDPLDFIISDVQPGLGFADETPIPDAGITVIFNHILQPLPDGGTRITHQVKIIGPAAEEVGPQLGPAITSDLPEAVAKLAALALAAEQ